MYLNNSEAFHAIQIICTLMLGLLFSCKNIHLKDPEIINTNVDAERPSWIVDEAPSELIDLFKTIRGGEIKLLSDSTDYSEITAWRDAVTNTVSDPSEIETYFSGIDISHLVAPEEKAAYLMSQGSLYKGIASQPEVRVDLLLKAPILYDSNRRITTEIEQIARYISYAEVLNGCAAQPEACEDIVEAAKDYSRAGMDFVFESSPDIILTRAYVIGELLGSMAYQPELSVDLIAATRLLVGAGTRESIESAKAWERAYIFNALLQSLVRQPELKPTLVTAAQSFIGPKASIRNNKLRDTIKTFVDSSVADAINAQPELDDDILEIKSLFY